MVARSIEALNADGFLSSFFRSASRPRAGSESNSMESGDRDGFEGSIQHGLGEPDLSRVRDF
jgi:hypothetical protein